MQLIRGIPSIYLPFAGSGHMVRNKLRWDASNAVGLSKQRNSYQSSPTFLCFESPSACNLRPSIIYPVLCDRIVQTAYSKCVLKLVEWFQNGALYHTQLPVNKRLYHISDGHARPLHAPSIKMEIWKCSTNKMIKGNQFLKKLSSFRKREIFAYSQVKISEVSTLHSPFGTHKWREQLNG